jgi:hypothetical protein
MSSFIGAGVSSALPAVDGGAATGGGSTTTSKSLMITAMPSPRLEANTSAQSAAAHIRTETSRANDFRLPAEAEARATIGRECCGRSSREQPPCIDAPTASRCSSSAQSRKRPFAGRHSRGCRSTDGQTRSR